MQDPAEDSSDYSFFDEEEEEEEDAATADKRAEAAPRDTKYDHRGDPHGEAAAVGSLPAARVEGRSRRLSTRRLVRRLWARALC